MTQCALRSYFDYSSHEWKESTIDEKIKSLKKLLNEDSKNTLNLSLGMMDYCNTQANKDIKPMDLVIAMSKIIDHLLLEEQS